METVAPPGPTVPPPVMADPPADQPGTTRGEPDEIPGAPAATTLPPGFADLTKTTKLEIDDSWNGMGATHDLLAMLEREPGARTFTVNAKVRAHGWPPFKESAPDPTAPRKRSETSASSNQPERVDYKTKKGTVDAAIVEAFLAEVAARQIDPKQDYRTGSVWTDDYPAGHVAVWVPNQAEPIHLAFRDQQRHWLVNGAFLTVDPGAGSRNPADFGRGGGVHQQIHERYRAMLTAMGLDAWMKELHGGRRGR